MFTYYKPQCRFWSNLFNSIKPEVSGDQGDVLSFMVQGGAAGFMVTGNNASLGSKIVVVGLVIQLVTFCLSLLPHQRCFIFDASTAHQRVS